MYYYTRQLTDREIERLNGIMEDFVATGTTLDIQMLSELQYISEHLNRLVKDIEYSVEHEE